ncbi:unnamed protein product [Adineta steineri]|uniref:non-specific serine/threonine protein kinase n=1 Tax=Adineta steineri TaxID=433720 RepID=A0A819PDQ6_9BILA|nr:unnamed protein product [Adineta steineri]CAF4008092.1 unnamed protein product [Adineta steineri]
MKKNELAAAEREAQLLSSLKHPNEVLYIGSFRFRDHHLNIVMAFCEGGDLYTKIKYRKKQLLNEEEIIEWFIQITLALQYMHERSILHRDLKTQNIFLTKQEIVKAGDISSLVLKVVRGQAPSLPSANVYSQQLIELINIMLDKDTENRPAAKQILQHPYIKQHIARLYKKTLERCHTNITTPPVQSSKDSDQSSIPPVPKPRASHLISSEENINEKPKSPIPPLKDEDEEKQQQSNIINSRFIAKIRENDTLARFKRQSSSPTHANQNDDNNKSRANVSARQRRREQRFYSTTSPIEEDNTQPKTPPLYDRSISNDSQIDAVEQERKAEKDINDFLHQLDATLRQPVSSTLTEIP